MPHVLTSYRSINAFLLLISVVAMSFAFFYLQKHLGLYPCELCVFQRIGVIIMGIFALLTLLINPKKRWIKLTLWLGSFAGIAWATGVAYRHVYMQWFPSNDLPSCGAGLEYMVNTLPLFEVIKQVFRGSGDCRAISWTFMGLSIPEQSSILFTLLTLVHVYLLLRILKSDVSVS